MDGQEQRFRDFAAPLLAWTIDLSQLDDEEVSNLEVFFVEQSGSFSAFDFLDPWNETVYSGCTLDNPEILLQYRGNQAGARSRWNRCQGDLQPESHLRVRRLSWPPPG